MNDDGERTGSDTRTIDEADNNGTVVGADAPEVLARRRRALQSLDDDDRILWEHYVDRRDQAARDHLVLRYAPLVKYVAGRLASGLPDRVELSDLISYGMFGLIDAIDKFEPAMGYKFETYAIRRIQGAILDELRALDWVPRSVRTRARQVERALAKLESDLGRAPSDAELAAELDMSETFLQETLAKISSMGIIALDEVLPAPSGQGETMTRADTITDPSDEPHVDLESRELSQTLAAVIDRMNEREKAVILLYYYENLTLAEIGQVLGVSESRVCQIHTKAVMQLRIRLNRRFAW